MFADRYRCPLCKTQQTAFFFEDRHRVYRCCAECALVFVPASFWLSPDEERAVYDLHENDVEDAGYRRFLSRLSCPLCERLPPGQKGLDFGCGPGPALAALLKERGHRVALIDPFFRNAPSVLEDDYDFICATEVVEHLQDPAGVFARLFGMLRPGGTLALMTKLRSDRQAFARWHYIRDPTHICFYSRATFEHVARCFDAELEFVADDVIFLKMTIPSCCPPPSSKIV